MPSTCRSSLLLILVVFASYSFAGYFLSWPQKGELLVTGGVTDPAGNQYDVRIIPGYLSLLNFGGNNWSDGWRIETKGGVRFCRGLLEIPVSLENLSDYVSPKPWQGMGDGFSQSIEGEKFLFTDFMWTGVGSTWTEYMGNAQNAQERQSFGWWFAYPWATIKGTVNTALRFTFGAAGVAGVAAYGIAIRPAWELSYPVLKTAGKTAMGTAHATYGVLQTSWGLGVNQLLLGVAAPISGYAWTTAVGVPMALVGRAPTPKSADGWWVDLVKQAPESIEASYPDSTALRALVQWQILKNTVKGRVTDRETEDSTALAPLDSQVSEAYSMYQRLDRSRDSLRDSLRYHTWLYRDSLETAHLKPTEKELPQSPANAEWNDENRDRLYSGIEQQVTSWYGDSLLESDREQMVRTIGTYWMQNGRSWFSKEYNRQSKFDPNRLIQDETTKIIDDR
jgi:hypothetical protein